MNSEPTENRAQASADAFIAELRHWREVSGVSQKSLAKLISFDPSYVSKVERGSVAPSRNFVEAADHRLRAGHALIRCWKEMQESLIARSGSRSRAQDVPVGDPQPGPEAEFVVEHEHAELSYLGGVYRTRIRRQLHNVGSRPVTQYLIRIAVDRYPGDPERSNQLYRRLPLTWEEIGLSAKCGDEPMTWRVKHDRDAFKEVWLLFENSDGRFPLYPGETTWFEYVYTVSADKWGPWWQRAIRVPTRRLNLTLDLPAELRPVVWGLETSMTAEASPVGTPISREQQDDRMLFTWSTDCPQLHARYRLEWKFKTANSTEEAKGESLAPSELMHALGIAQDGDPILAEVGRPFVAIQRVCVAGVAAEISGTGCGVVA